MSSNIFLALASLGVILSAIAFITKYHKKGIYDAFNNSPALQNSLFVGRKMLYYSGVPLVLFILGGILMLIAIFL